MPRIIAGSHGGRVVTAPEGRVTRPTSDRVREALFSTLGSLTELVGCRFADLYAGSGAVGLEAASRGAASVLLVEADPKAAKVAQANIVRLKLSEHCRLLAARVEAVVASAPPGGPFDLVFADPPYEATPAQVDQVLRALAEGDWLTPHAVVVFERSSRSPAPDWGEGLAEVRTRRYGETTVWYGRPS